MLRTPGRRIRALSLRQQESPRILEQKKSKMRTSMYRMDWDESMEKGG